MKHILVSLALLVTLAHPQWVETTIPLPDSLSGLDGISAVLFHSPNGTVYVGHDSTLIAVDAATYRKTARVTFPGSLGIMSSSTASNKLYCSSNSYYTHRIAVIDGATNRFLTAVPIDSVARDLCYAATANKVYVAGPRAVYVIDCETDSVTATIGPLSEPSALCYNPLLNRIYSAQSGSDEVAVIDCVADSVIRTIWVRGVDPFDICFDSVANCVYTANYTSGTVSVIDCAGDSLLRIVATGNRPARLVAGPEGKVYCGSYHDSVLTVVATGGIRTIPVGRNLLCLSYDPTNAKVYCATSGSQVVVIDAIGDTVAARVGAGEDLELLCYDPVGNSTLAASMDGSTVGVIDGVTNRLTDSLWFGVFRPGALCYNPVNNHLYCIEDGWNRNDNHLIVIDGDSSRVLKILPAGNSTDSMVWNALNNKIYFSNSGDNTVSIVDCTTDSIVATVGTGDWPSDLCCSNNGKVYAANEGGGVTVIDGSGDTVCATVATTDHAWTLSYDRTDNKVYCGMWNGNPVNVIDCTVDSVVVTVPATSAYQMVCWNQNHDKVYVCGWNDSDTATVIDCAGDTTLRNILLPFGSYRAYSDSTADKVYFANISQGHLYVVNAANDTLYRTLIVGSAVAFRDNGLPGSSNRLYCADYNGGYVVVVSGATDSILRRIPVGTEPIALAWNPVHSWMYVSNSGSSSITVIRDTLPAGSVDGMPGYGMHASNVAAVVRGVLFLPTASGHKPQAASLLDIAGRHVLDLKPGANDVRALAPGVYFVRAVSREPSAVSCHKVVIAR